MRRGGANQLGGRLLAALWLLLCVGRLGSGCNDRFEFDVPAAAGSAGHSPNQAGASAGGGGGAPESCGASPSCPIGLRCIGTECAPCASDVDCGPSLPRCHPTEHRCVACLASTDCAAGSTCDALANHCLPSCEEEVDCPVGSHGCDEQRGVCYQCDEDRECLGSALGPMCAKDGSGCVQCRVDTDCSAPLFCELRAGRCVQCRGGNDCTSALCDADGRCLTR